jgi:hypothetical protein
MQAIPNQSPCFSSLRFSGFGRVGVVSGFVGARILPIAKTKIAGSEQENDSNENPLDRQPSLFGLRFFLFLLGPLVSVRREMMFSFFFSHFNPSKFPLWIAGCRIV